MPYKSFELFSPFKNVFIYFTSPLQFPFPPLSQSIPLKPPLWLHPLHLIYFVVLALWELKNEVLS